jgi:exodeoxyribonuclease VIII
MTPGIHALTNEDYHAAPGISKTGLWTIHTKTPFHFRYGERKSSSFFDLGSAAHTAVLEPVKLDFTIMCGPDDRRGNKWKDAQERAAHEGLTLLTGPDYDRLYRIRDSADKNATLRALRPGLVVEQSGFAIDPETGVLCRCRPDGYQPSSGIILDLKTTTDGGASAFARSVANFGYHVQDAFYSGVWQQALISGVEHFDNTIPTVYGFVFVVVETTAPYVTSTYELDPSAVDEGRAIYRAALARYAECARTDVWPAYPDEPEPLKLPRWAHKLTPAPDYREEDLA